MGVASIAIPSPTDTGPPTGRAARPALHSRVNRAMSVTLRPCDGKANLWEVDIRILLRNGTKLRERRQPPSLDRARHYDGLRRGSGYSSKRENRSDNSSLPGKSPP